jgi:hypothetical protein
MFCALSISVKAQAPDSLAYQGFLTDDAGVPINGTVDLEFRILEITTGLVWRETQTGVEVVDGVFSVYLGSVESLSGIAFDRPLKLKVFVNGEPLPPARPFASVPYALSVRGIRVIPSDDPNHAPSLIGGHFGNSVETGINGATIGGGGTAIHENYVNRVQGDYGTICGGNNNQVNSYGGIVGGTANNATGSASFVGGGSHNSAQGEYAVIGGGNENWAPGRWAVVAGGQDNDAEGDKSFVGGGFRSGAGGFASVVGGGSRNFANGDYSFVGGGARNGTGGSYSAVLGGHYSRAYSDFSFAAGRRAIVRELDHGTFVWADHTDADFESTGEDQFLIRAGGGVGIGTNQPDTGQLQVEFAQHCPDATCKKIGVLVETDVDGGAEKPTFKAENLNEVNGVAGVFTSHGTDVTLFVNQSGTGDLIRGWVPGGPGIIFKVAKNGNVTADGSFTGGGADVAEMFSAEGAFNQYEPGDVLVISEHLDRTVTKSDKSYSTKVLGVYATKPGVVLRNLDIEEEIIDQLPIGVLGVVPTKVTSENGPIQRGDLLVTSGTAGHAMKANPEDLGFGMVLGKALQPFEGASGMIDVMVNVR